MRTLSCCFQKFFCETDADHEFETLTQGLDCGLKSV